MGDRAPVAMLSQKCQDDAPNLLEFGPTFYRNQRVLFFPPRTTAGLLVAMLRVLLLSALSSALAENYVAWSSVTSSGSGPGGRVSMASTAKSIAETAALGDQVWIFGGISSAVPPVYSSELWTFDMHTATWSQFAKAGSPPALEGSVMCAVCCSAPQLHMPCLQCIAAGRHRRYVVRRWAISCTSSEVET